MRYCYKHRVFDEALESAVNDLMDNSCLPRLVELTRQTYAANLRRHELVLGDDNQTFGLLTAKNISNRARRDQQLQSRASGTRVLTVDGSVEIHSAGRVLKHYKLPGLSAAVDVYSISWVRGEARAVGGRHNSSLARAYGVPAPLADHQTAEGAEQLTFDTGEQGAAAFHDVAPGSLRLHLAHTADEQTGEVVVYLGFPCSDGDVPWYAVRRLRPDDGDPRWSSGVDEPSGPPTSDGPAYDDLPTPVVPLRLRPARPTGDASP